MATKYVVKNAGKLQKAWELNEATLANFPYPVRPISEEHPRVQAEIAKGNLPSGAPAYYEVFSLEAQSGEGQIAVYGDFIKVDGTGHPYPNREKWFLENHRHIEGDTWEQIPKPLLAWEATDEVTPEVEFLVNHKGLVLNPDTPDQYFRAPLWGAWLTAASDAVLIFYSVTRDDEGSVTDAEFNFVAKVEFERTYHYC